MTQTGIYANRWLVNRTLGEGGQGHTFTVRDIQNPSNDLFVLKRLKDGKNLQRFIGEISACQKLDHTNAVRLVDFNPANDPPYLVMEFCEGGDLANLKVPMSDIKGRLHVFLQISRAVAHAHSLGIVHRDLKPENIFLRTDQITPVVGDFGICFYTPEEGRVTLTDEPVGARHFIAPELEDGRAEEVSPAADVYSLGKVLYWLLSGRSFAREKHRDERFDLTRSTTDAGIHLAYELLDKMIVADRTKRPPDGTALVGLLESTLVRLDINAHPIGPDAPQSCNYCGIGAYMVFANPNTSDRGVDNARQFGLSGGISSPSWLILICNHCGNVQLFRPDRAKNPKVWGPG